MTLTEYKAQLEIIKNNECGNDCLCAQAIPCNGEKRKIDRAAHLAAEYVSGRVEEHYAEVLKGEFRHLTFVSFGDAVRQALADVKGEG